MIFEVVGKVRGKGRPRFARRGSFVNTYTDENTLSYESEIKYAFLQAGGKKIDGMVFMGITVFQSPPKSASKKKSEEMLSNKVMPTKKPDLDNVAKIVCDALNKVAYDDDTQIVYLSAAKQYAEQEKIVITIFEHIGGNNNAK